MMIYTALGDSITFGENASSWAKAYPQLTVSALNARQSGSRKVHGVTLARPGWTSHRLLEAMIWHGASIIGRSDVVSVWIGGVDLAGAAITSFATKQPIDELIEHYRRNLSAIFKLIKQGSRARIVSCTQYNPFPNSPVAVEGIGRLNGLIAQLSHQNGVTVAPAHSWFEGKQAALIHGYRTGKIEDALSGRSLPIHPNNRGHQVIAAGLAPYLIRRR